MSVGAASERRADLDEIDGCPIRAIGDVDEIVTTIVTGYPRRSDIDPKTSDT